MKGVFYVYVVQNNDFGRVSLKNFTFTVFYIRKVLFISIVRLFF